MINIQSFINNPYQENTYILSDESGKCAIIDPGMYTSDEQNNIIDYIKSNNLTPEVLLNTHCHIDHVLGNKFIFDNYSLVPQFHQGELVLLQSIPSYAPMQGIRYELSPEPKTFLPESGVVRFGNSELELIFAPGHSPAHLCFYSKEDKFIIGGDVLFRGSIGRTDLPGGNYNTLINSIRNNIFTLADDIVVYPGHGPETTIGYEKQHNPFF
jgi:hydroxyacylglutathione hydrolase